MAAGKGHTNIVRLLLQRSDIDVNQANKFGFSPLYMAANDGYVESVELLVCHMDINLTKACKNGFTPLGLALRRRDQKGGERFEQIVNLLKEGIQRPKDEIQTCIICLDQRAEVVLLPCGHQNMCSPCAFQWNEEKKGCPCDRMKVSEILPLLNRLKL